MQVLSLAIIIASDNEWSLLTTGIPQVICHLSEVPFQISGVSSLTVMFRVPMTMATFILSAYMHLLVVLWEIVLVNFSGLYCCFHMLSPITFFSLSRVPVGAAHISLASSIWSHLKSMHMTSFVVASYKPQQPISFPLVGTGCHINV